MHYKILQLKLYFNFTFKQNRPSATYNHEPFPNNDTILNSFKSLLHDMQNRIWSRQLCANVSSMHTPPQYKHKSQNQQTHVTICGIANAEKMKNISPGLAKNSHKQALLGKGSLLGSKYETRIKSKHDRTRGHTLKLSKHCTRRDVRLYFFSERVINNWNHLDQSVIEAGCVNTFKRRLHDHRNDKMDLFMD